MDQAGAIPSFCFACNRTQPICRRRAKPRSKARGRRQRKRLRRSRLQRRQARNRRRCANQLRPPRRPQLPQRHPRRRAKRKKRLSAPPAAPTSWRIAPASSRAAPRRCSACKSNAAKLSSACRSAVAGHWRRQALAVRRQRHLRRPPRARLRPLSLRSGRSRRCGRARRSGDPRDVPRRTAVALQRHPDRRRAHSVLPCRSRAAIVAGMLSGARARDAVSQGCTDELRSMRPLVVHVRYTPESDRDSRWPARQLRAEC